MRSVFSDWKVDVNAIIVVVAAAKIDASNRRITKSADYSCQIHLAKLLKKIGVLSVY
jgi:hypothetical protein